MDNYQLRDRKINIAQAINIATTIVTTRKDLSILPNEDVVARIGDLAPIVYRSLFKSVAANIYKEHYSTKAPIKDLNALLNELDGIVADDLVAFRNNNLPSTTALSRADAEILSTAIINKK